MDPCELFVYLAIVCSKEKKHLQVVEYWRKKYDEYQDRSDERPETDSGDPYDHGFRPQDPTSPLGPVPLPQGKKNKVHVFYC